MEYQDPHPMPEPPRPGEPEAPGLDAIYETKYGYASAILESENDFADE